MRTLLAILVLAASAQAQLWSGVLDPQRAIDWTTAGVTGGIPTNRTQCGSTISAYNGTAATINTAITNCGANQYVQLGAGTFNLTTGILITKNNVTVRGLGPDQTFLVFTGNDSCLGWSAPICVSNPSQFSTVSLPNNANLSGTMSKGSTTLTFSTTTNLSVGTLLLLSQANDSNTDNGQVWVCSTGGICATDGGGGFMFSGRDQQQVVKVTNISGSSVTFTPGLYMPNWRVGQSPQAGWVTDATHGVGIEALSIEGLNAGAIYNITFAGTYDDWVKNVRSMNSNKANIQTRYTAHITVRDSYFFGTQNAASQSYGIETDSSSDGLVENNIAQQVTSPFTTGGSAVGWVYGYNFALNHPYTNPAWMQRLADVHAVGTTYTLFEGNDGDGFSADAIHGTSHFQTLFRNRLRGWMAGGTLATIAVNTYAYNRFYNVIGNVLGQTSYHTTYECVATVASATGGCASDTIVYDLGWETVGGSCNPCGDSNATINNDPLVKSSIMRWGNYDTVNGAVRFLSAEVPSGIANYPNPLPANQTLPSSFYLSAQPSTWWGVVGQSAIPWPAIGPDISGGSYSERAFSTNTWVSPSLGGHVNMTPAASCFKNVMGGPADGSGAVLTFNANSCYTNTAATAPIANFSATSLTFAGQNVNTSSPTQTITLTNTGTAALSLTSITLGGTGATSYFQSNNCPTGSSLGIGSSCTMTVTFTPLISGSISGSITVVDSAADSPQTVTLSGTGIQATNASTIGSGVTITGGVVIK